MTRQLGTVGLFISLIVLALLSPVHPVQAAGITVNGSCSLANAILSANTDTGVGGCDPGFGTDTITLTANVTLTTVLDTVQGPTALPSITSAIIIEGNGYTIARDGAAPTFRIFRVATGGSLTLNNLTISGGRIIEDDLTNGSGGGIRVDGGTLVTTNVTMTNNHSFRFGGAIEHVNGIVTINGGTFSNNSSNSGGAIDSWATNSLLSDLTIQGGTLFTGNQATPQPGNTSVFQHGGAIYIGGGSATTIVTITDAIFTNNTAVSTGGALRALGNNEGGTVTVTVINSTIDNNHAASGGAADNDIGNGTNSTMTFLNSTLSNNTASVNGGGIFNISGTINVHQSTLSGNSSSGDGGDIYTDHGTVSIIQSTLANSNAPDGGGVFAFDPAASVSISNTIIDSNSVANCSGTGIFINNGNNLSGDTSCPFGGGNSQDPHLLALATNGGPTQTHALETTSPALNAGNPAICANPPVNGVDQRGQTRPNPVGENCDIGAFEASINPPSTYSFDAASYSVTEGDGGGFNTNATVRVNRTGSTSGSSSVQIALSNGPTPAATGGATANPGIDYDNSTLTVNFSAGTTFRNVTIPVASDAIDEVDEHLTLTLTNPSGGTLIGAPASTVLTILDEDESSIDVIETGGTTAVTEGGATDTFSVELGSQPSNGTVTFTANPGIQCNLGDGAGVAVTHDFTSANWYTPWVVTVTAINDSIAEGTHSCPIGVSITSSTSPEYSVSTIVPDVTATITDNETAGVSVVQNGGGTAITEGGASDSFTLVLTSQPSSGTVTVRVDPDDQCDLGQGAGNPVTHDFAAGNWNTAWPITVTALDDAVAEGAHNCVITNTISASTTPEYPTSLSVTNVTAAITDNDTAGVTVTQSDETTAVTEGGTSDTLSIVLTSQPSSGTVVITADPDAQCSVGSGAGVAATRDFTSGNWSTSWDIIVNAVDDTIVEGTHSCLIALAITSSGSSEYPVSSSIPDVTATITDNDTATVILASATGTANESDGTYSTTVILSISPEGATLGSAVNFGIARANVSTANADFAGATTSGGSFAAGSANGTTRTITTPITDDKLTESNETFTLTLNNVTGPATAGSPAVQTVTLVSDDHSPAAANDAYNTLMEVPLSVPAASGVLANDTDSDAGDSLTAQLISGPAHASSFTLNANGSFNYTPANGFNGPDTFTYRASDGTNTSASATVTISVAIPIPPAPALLTPADTTITGNNFPLFTWNSVAYAVTYEIQIDSDNTFTTPAIESSSTEASFAPTTGLVDNTLYYWRVRGLNSFGNPGDWSTVWTVAIDTTRLTPPQLRSPRDLSNIPDTTPAFRWTSVRGGVEYRLQVDDMPDFSSPLDTGPDPITAPRYTVPTDLPYGTYFWRVQVREESGLWSDWSTEGTFTITILNRPVNGDFMTDATPTFRWSGIKGAAVYELQVDTDPNFGSSPLPASYTGDKRVFTPDTNLPANRYYWRVRVNGGPWTPAWTFTITPAPGAKPSLVSPANKLLSNTNLLSFVWDGLTDGETYHYQIQIDTKTNFGAPVQDHVGGVGELTYDAAPLADGVYFWRVRGINSLNVAGKWSVTWRVEVDTTAPAVPELIGPANLSVTTDTTPVFSWKRERDARTYRLIVSTDPALTSPIIDQPGLTTPRYVVPNAGALPNGLYYWGVIAEDKAGNASSASTPFLLTITDAPVLPDAPELLTPTDGTVSGTAVQVFEWNTAAGGDTYEIQIDNDRKFRSPEQDTIGTSGVTTYPAAPLADGTSFWRVRAISSGGVAGPWSQPWRITIDTTAPTIPTLTLPKNGKPVYTVLPVYKWRGLRDAVIYHLQVSTDPTFASTLINEEALTGTQFTQPTALQSSVYYWHVRAQDAMGNWSGWSDTFNFTVTILKSPADASITRNARPTFTWAKTNGAVGYCLQVDNNADFLSAEINELGLTKTTFRPAAALDDGLYYWHVSVDTGMGCTTWMETWTFTITPKPPSKVKLESPANNWLTSDNTPTLAWKAVAGTAIYQIQLDDDKAFGSPSVDTPVDGALTTFTANALPDALYYWRVRAVNSVGVAGPWSTPWRFTLDTTPPVKPVLVNPVDGMRVTNKQLKLGWTKINDAARYEVQIDTDPGFPLPALDAGKKLAYKPKTSLAQATYYWRVRAIDAAGNVSQWSDPWSFNLIAGNTVVDDVPDDVVNTPPTPPNREEPEIISLEPAQPPVSEQPVPVEPTKPAPDTGDDPPVAG